MIAPREMPAALHVRVVTGQGGGPDKTILRSPRYMRERGYEELCAYLRPARDDGFDALRAQAAQHDAELVEIDDGGPFDMLVVRKLVDLCRRRHIRIWHGHDYKSNALGLVVKRFVPLRLVTTVHGWVHHTPRTPLYYFVDRCCLRWYERVLCVSRDLDDACVRAGVRRERCLPLSNGIELEHFERRLAPAGAREQLGLSPDVPLIGAVGRLAKEKGFAVLLGALRQLRESGLAFQAAIIGDGAERGALLALAKELGVQDHIHFAGHRSDVRSWYEAMDIFALSSLREAMPNVVLEAMAMQTPVVATRIAGVPDMLDGGRCGAIVPPASATELASALADLLQSPHRRANLAATAREFVASRYSFAARMDRMQAIYDELLFPA
jgi:glycosyltransferase involved in cell wall biosynthesis